MSQNPTDDNELNEPQAVYQRTGLRFFGSFKNMNEANAQDMAAIPGEVHLQNLTARIESYYAEELKQPMDKTLKFRE